MKKVICALIVLLLSACGFKPSSTPSYYVLALPEYNNEKVETSKLGTRILVSTITIPAYLDRPEIALRTGSDVEFSDFNRWAEDLDDGINRILIDSLNQDLKASNSIAFPINSVMPYDVRLSIDVLRFDGDLNSTVALEIVWILTDNEGQVVKNGHFIDETNSGNDFNSFINAHSLLLNNFGKNIATIVMD